MKTRLVLILVSGLLLVFTLAWLLLSRNPHLQPASFERSMVELPTPTPPPPQRAVLLFVGSDSLLHPEIRNIPLPTELDLRVQRVVEALLEGPKSNLAPLFPYPAEMRAVFVDQHRRAYVDFNLPQIPPGGTDSEALMVYGVVNSILLNSELKSVQLLFDGKEVQTLGGHLNLSRPLLLNKSFIGK